MPAGSNYGIFLRNPRPINKEGERRVKLRSFEERRMNETRSIDIEQQELKLFVTAKNYVLTITSKEIGS